MDIAWKPEALFQEAFLLNWKHSSLCVTVQEGLFHDVNIDLDDLVVMHQYLGDLFLTGKVSKGPQTL